jgi:hypothetical protein
MRFLPDILVEVASDPKTRIDIAANGKREMHNM